MPQVVKAIGNTYDTITRPVVFCVAQDVLKMMGFDKDAFLSFKGFTEVAVNRNSSLDPINKSYFGTDTIAEIEVAEKPRQNMLYTMSVLRPDELCVFRDEKSNLFLRPVKQMTEIEIQFSLRFHSKTEAMRWRDDIHGRSARFHHKNYHRVTYSYPIPPIYMNFLYDMHQLIKVSDPTEEQDFADYFFKFADERTSTLTNLSGADHMVVVPETQVRVLGWWNFDEVVDKPVHDKDANTWTISWSYTFLYDKVIECALFHELVVRQEPIPAKWFPEEPYDLDQEKQLAGSNSNMLAEHHMPDFEKRGGIYHNRSPVTDTWFPIGACRQDLRNYTPIFIILTTLLPDNNRLVLNLKEMGDFELSPASLALIQKEHMWVTTVGESIFNVSIFGNESIALPEQQFLDADLNLQTHADLNRTPVYRVVISVIKDLSLLSNPAIDRAKDNACLMKDVIDSVWTNAAELGLIPKPNHRCQWTKDQWDYIVDLLRPEKSKPWVWGWPPRVPGLDLHPGHKPGGDKNHPDSLSLLSTIRTLGIFTLVGKRKDHASISTAR